MNIETYNTVLKEILEHHQFDAYEREGEGLVFVGPPKPIVNLNKQEKHEFIYLFCMFLAVDLKTYEIYHEYYYPLKKAFYIPKFEFGLTNTFVRPDRVFRDNKIGINEVYFNNSFNSFYSFIKELTKKIDSDFNVLTLLKSISEDSDINTGLFGGTFSRFINARIMEEC